MSRIHLIKTIFCVLLWPVVTYATAVNITFNVTVPAGTPQVYIIGNSDALGNWQADEGRSIAMEQTSEVTWHKTIALEPNTSYSYMFLCGPAWVYEQSPNVSTTFVTGTTDGERNNTVTAWNSMPEVVLPVTFTVTVPEATKTVFLIGSDELGNWEADKGRSLKMVRQPDGSFSLTIDLKTDTQYSYQYLSGAGWAYRQLQEERFSVNTSATSQVNDAVTGWLAQPEPQADIQHYLRRDGNRIVDADGNNFIIRAIGLGNYMVWEPYMWKVSNYEVAGIMQQIVERMSEALNPDDLQYFIDQYMASYITKADVDSLKAWGFNAIRLPMHYNLFISADAADNTFVEKGFAITEQLRQWCADNEMYLILDLHAAPGGQGNDHAISDSRSPALWDGDELGTAEQYQDKVVILWRELARRFADKEYMGGYDILNETNYGGDNLKLLDLFKRCVNQIRLYDQKNIIYLEGNWFANDFSTILPGLWGTQWDENMAYSSHKYWALHNGFAGEDVRATYNVPLFLGETGENSNEWFYQNVKSAEHKNIGWAWWAYKKIDNISGFTSIRTSESFKKISDFINEGTGLDVNNKEANFEVFLDFLEYVKLENCKINYDVLFSLIDQQQDAALTKPYGDNRVPGVIPATHYDLGRQGFAWFENHNDQVIERTEGLGDAKPYNAGWAGRNDAVDFEVTAGEVDPASDGYNIGWTNAGEWVQYSVYAEQEGYYRVSIRSACLGDVTVSLRDTGNGLLRNNVISATGGWQSWELREVGNVKLEQGWNTLRLYFDDGAININYLKFDFITAVNQGRAGEDLTAFVQGDTLRLQSVTPIDTSLVFSLDGKVLLKAQGSHEISISQLRQGIYLAKVFFRDGTSRNIKFLR